MPVLQKRTVLIKDKDGKILQLTETDQIAEEIEILVKCDSAKCASRHDGEQTEVAWTTEQVKEDPNALPDAFFRLITLIVDPKTQKQLIFCSPSCVKDFLQYEYILPLSPREEAEIMANNQKVEAAKKNNVVQFKSPAEQMQEIAAGMTALETAPSETDPGVAAEPVVAVEIEHPGVDLPVAQQEDVPF